MDPDAALREVLAIVARVLAGGADDAGSELARLAELLDGLHGWITRGGFLPAAWVIDDVAVVEVVRRALQPCGLAVVPQAGDVARTWAVVCTDDAGAFGVGAVPGVAYARHLTARELARWADGWRACWRVWGGGG